MGIVSYRYQHIAAVSLSNTQAEQFVWEELEEELLQVQAETEQ